MNRSTVDFHFDPMCPFAYQTSVWIRDVRAQIGLTVNWRFFSLEEINRFEGKKHPWERPWSYGWSLMRIGALLRRQSMELLDEWYASVGEALHMRGEKPHDPSVARKLLAELDADPALLDEAISDLTTHEDVKDDHQRVVDAGGFGVPTLLFPDGQRLFGPVLVGPPTGADALKLWNVVTGMADLEHVYELQRPKTRQDLELISEHLQPYLNGRDWVSVNRGEIVDFTGGTA